MTEWDLKVHGGASYALLLPLLLLYNKFNAACESIRRWNPCTPTGTSIRYFRPGDIADMGFATLRLSLVCELFYRPCTQTYPFSNTLIFSINNLVFNFDKRQLE